MIRQFSYQQTEEWQLRWMRSKAFMLPRDMLKQFQQLNTWNCSITDMMVNLLAHRLQVRLFQHGWSWSTTQSIKLKTALIKLFKIQRLPWIMTQNDSMINSKYSRFDRDCLLCHRTHSDSPTRRWLLWIMIYSHLVIFCKCSLSARCLQETCS